MLIDGDLMEMLGFIKKLRIPDEKEVSSRGIFLGEHLRDKTLIFDLDETLIHA